MDATNVKIDIAGLCARLIFENFIAGMCWDSGTWDEVGPPAADEFHYCLR